MDAYKVLWNKNRILVHYSNDIALKKIYFGKGWAKRRFLSTPLRTLGMYTEIGVV